MRESCQVPSLHNNPHSPICLGYIYCSFFIPCLLAACIFLIRKESGNCRGSFANCHAVGALRTVSSVWFFSLHLSHVVLFSLAILFIYALSKLLGILAGFFLPFRASLVLISCPVRNKNWFCGLLLLFLKGNSFIHPSRKLSIDHWGKSSAWQGRPILKDFLFSFAW